jgi:alkylation response protein AidB-like acyl-CoA dehydrogenase
MSGAELTEDRRVLRESVRGLMDRIATPAYLERLDRDQAYPEELYAAWVEHGLLCVPFPEEYGGLGGGVIEMLIIAEELARKSYDFYAAFGGSAFLGLGLLKNGTEAQKREWLPRLMQGRVKFALGMSEPEAGSDLGAMRTSAELRSGEWVLNGQKVWTTGAGARNNVIQVYARTEKNVHHSKGLSLFLVENDRPGVALKKLDMLGRRCVGTYQVTFNEVRLPQERLIGVVNQGWTGMMSCLEVERITGTAAYCGNAQGIVDLTLEYAKERKQFGRPIGSNQAIAHLLADMQTEVAAARALTWSVASRVAAGETVLAEVCMAKLFASETLVKAANRAMEVFGANGYSMEYPIQRYFRDARSATTAGGTSQMQRNAIARSLGLKIT